MQIPNLLNMAMQVVGKQSFSYLKYLSRSLNDVGGYIPTYDIAKQLYGQVQAVPRNLYQVYGLDFQKNYLIFYVSKDIIDIGRNVSGDQMKFNNKTYQCLSETDWFPINGWTGVLCVQVSDA